MKRDFVWRFLTHATLLLAALFLTLLVLDQYNPSMDFISSDVSKWFLLGFALCAFISSIMTAVRQFQARRRDDGEKNREE
ncbi:MAG TPA: hypothetical protein VN540_10730 [Clostridia bacterium]|nr:hypothetical protein [Clostridia bacterium]